MAYRAYRSPVRAAKAYAKAAGYKGDRGGWIRRVDTNQPMCQGWDEFASLCLRRRWVVTIADLGCLPAYGVPLLEGEDASV